MGNSAVCSAGRRSRMPGADGERTGDMAYLPTALAFAFISLLSSTFFGFSSPPLAYRHQPNHLEIAIAAPATPPAILLAVRGFLPYRDHNDSSRPALAICQRNSISLARSRNGEIRYDPFSFCIAKVCAGVSGPHHCRIHSDHRLRKQFRSRLTCTAVGATNVLRV